MNETETVILGQELLKAARIGDDVDAELLLSRGANVNTRDLNTGLTALHYAAGCRAWHFVRVLEAISELDYLQKDNKGRLPSAMAYEVANDPELGEYLLTKEVEQAEKMGRDYPAVLASRPLVSEP